MQEDRMAVTVYIPTPFRRATNNRDRLEASAKTVGGLLDELEGTFTGLKGLVRGEGGEVHHHVNIYVNSEAIESLDGLASPLKAAAEVAVIYHSHVDAGAYFSETDRRQALIGDEPLYPGAAYLVTSVMRGRVDSVAAFRWDAARGDFLPVDLAVSEPSSGRHAT